MKKMGQQLLPVFPELLNELVATWRAKPYIDKHPIPRGFLLGCHGMSSSLQCLGISIRGLPASQSQPLSVRSDGQELQGGHPHCPSHECVPAPYAPYEAELQEEMTESCRERSAELLTTAFTSIKLWSMSQAEQWVRRESQVVKPHQPCYER